MRSEDTKQKSYVAHIQLSTAHITANTTEATYGNFVDEVTDLFKSNQAAFIEFESIERGAKPMMILSSRIEAMWLEEESQRGLL